MFVGADGMATLFGRGIRRNIESENMGHIFEFIGVIRINSIKIVIRLLSRTCFNTQLIRFT